MATATVTLAKAAAGSAPGQPAGALRRIAGELTRIAAELGDAGLTGVDVTLVVNDAPASGADASFTISGGSFAVARSFEVNA